MEDGADGADGDASGHTEASLSCKHNLLQLTQEHAVGGMLKGLAHGHLR